MRRESEANWTAEPGDFVAGPGKGLGPVQVCNFHKDDYCSYSMDVWNIAELDELCVVEPYLLSTYTKMQRAGCSTTSPAFTACSDESFSGRCVSSTLCQVFP